MRRRALDASVAASVAAIAVLAFRGTLWWIVGITGAVPGPSHFALLVGGVATAAFGVVLAAESLLRSHAGGAAKGRTM